MIGDPVGVEERPLGPGHPGRGLGVLDRVGDAREGPGVASLPHDCVDRVGPRTGTVSVEVAQSIQIGVVTLDALEARFEQIAGEELPGPDVVGQVPGVALVEVAHASAGAGAAESARCRSSANDFSIASARMSTSGHVSRSALSPRLSWPL